MKSAWSTSFTIVDADGEYTSEFEAYVAQEIARLEADVDDPVRGEDASEMLEMDRRELRALSAVTFGPHECGPTTDDAADHGRPRVPATGSHYVLRRLVSAVTHPSALTGETAGIQSSGGVS